MITGIYFRNVISWAFGVLVLLTGLVNTFWGNDPGFGIALVLCSFLYYPPANAFLKDKTGIKIPAVLKIIMGFLVTWAALGVGELSDKIHLMMMDIIA